MNRTVAAPSIDAIMDNNINRANLVHEWKVATSRGDLDEAKSIKRQLNALPPYVSVSIVGNSVTLGGYTTNESDKQEGIGDMVCEQLPHRTAGQIHIHRTK